MKIVLYNGIAMNVLKGLQVDIGANDDVNDDKMDLLQSQARI